MSSKQKISIEEKEKLVRRCLSGELGVFLAVARPQVYFTSKGVLFSYSSLKLFGTSGTAGGFPVQKDRQHMAADLEKFLYFFIVRLTGCSSNRGSPVLMMSIYYDTLSQ